MPIDIRASTCIKTDFQVLYQVPRSYGLGGATKGRFLARNRKHRNWGNKTIQTQKLGSPGRKLDHLVVIPVCNPAASTKKLY